MGGAASQRENELVLDVLNIAEAAFAVDDHRRIVAWNDAAECLLGIAAQDIIGTHCYETLAAHGAARCAQCGGCPVGALYVESDADGAAYATKQPDRSISLTTLNAHTTNGGSRIVHLLHESPQAPRLPHFTPHQQPHAIETNSIQPNPAASGSKHPHPHTLTQRELEVLRLLGAGHSTADIAGSLNITRVTARNHVNKVLDKLGANSRLQAVVIASQLRLI